MTMTVQQARDVVRHGSRHHVPVSIATLTEALQVIRHHPERRKKLPLLRKEDRERINCILLFNLGRAIGPAA